MSDHDDPRHPPIIARIHKLTNACPNAQAIASASAGVIQRAQLLDTINALVAGANGAGIHRGDRVGVMVTDNLDFGLWFLAAVQGGFCVVPFSADTPLPTLIRQVRQARCSQLVAPLAWMEQVNPDLLAHCNASIVSFTHVAQPAQIQLDLLCSAPDTPRAENAGACLILKTSGTTGDPKLVPLSPALLQRSADRVAQDIELTESDHGVCLMPLLHVHGLVACFLAPLISGGRVTVLEAMDIDGLINTVVDGSATWFSGVPTIHLAVTQRLSTAGVDTAKARIRVLRSASAPLPDVAREQYLNILGAPVIEAYGMTEAGHQITSQTLGEQSPNHSVGKPNASEVQLRDADTGQLKTEGSGEVVLNLGNFFPGYLNVTDDTTWQDGWFRTGDLGRIEADGSLVLTGRSKEMINRGGETISPREIENALLAVPGIDLACVFAVPHPTLGEAIEAAVVQSGSSPDAIIDDATIRKFLFRILQDHHFPQKLNFVDQLQTSESGKINRRALQNLFAGS